MINKYLKNIKILGITIIFITMFVYSVKSISYIYNWSANLEEKQIEYSLLTEKKQQMDDEIEILKVKVYGLRDESINLEILEIQAKYILNLYKKSELIIYD